MRLIAATLFVVAFSILPGESNAQTKGKLVGCSYEACVRGKVETVCDRATDLTRRTTCCQKVCRRP